MFSSYRKQSVDLQSKSADWFLYDGNIGSSDIGQCPSKIKICPTKRKTHRAFCPTRKTRSKIKCPTRLCFCPTISWRCPTNLLILSNRYLSNKSFLINKLQYPKYSFLQKHLYRKTLQKYNYKSFVFTSSSANKKKTLNRKWFNIFHLLEHW